MKLTKCLESLLYPKNGLPKNIPSIWCGQNITQRRLVHHHKELEEPGGLERFMGYKRSNPQRANRNTHVNERKFRRLRGAKTVLIELEEHTESEQVGKMNPDQMRVYLLRKGRPNPFKDVSVRGWNERQITFQSHNDVVEAYIPPEKSIISRMMGEGIRGMFGDVKDYCTVKYTNLMGYGLRRIRKKKGFEDFEIKDFPKIAEGVYVEAFSALMRRDRPALHQLITESAFSKFWPDVERGTLRWELIEFVEPSRVVTVRCVDQPVKSGNDIAQITVRMHTIQKLAFYDKDGRLLLGSEQEPRECLEYVVFENHIASSYGKWRFHAKVYPNWLKPKQSLLKPNLLATAKEADKKIENEYEGQLYKLHPGTGKFIERSQERKEKGDKKR